MSLRVNNSTAFSAYTNLTQSSNKLNSSMSRLSKGIKSSVDDAAGVGISERMRAQARGTAMSRQNVENGISALQTADSWMQGINDMLGRMKELAVEAGDVTMSDDDRSNLNEEFGQLSDEITRIKTSVKYNDIGLLNGSLAGDTVVGADGEKINISGVNISDTATALAGLSITNATAAGTALGVLGSAVDSITSSRSKLGATQNRLENTRSGLLTYEDNIRAAESKIRDVDMARESSNMVKNQILSQVGNAMLAQANQLPQGILQLIG